MVFKWGFVHRRGSARSFQGSMKPSPNVTHHPLRKKKASLHDVHFIALRTTCFNVGFLHNTPAKRKSLETHKSQRISVRVIFSCKSKFFGNVGHAST